MNPRERYDDIVEAFLASQDGAQSRMWTAFPGEVQDFDADNQICTVQPAIRSRLRGEDGTVTSYELPLLTNCPVQFPSGGNCTLTVPLAKGDEVLVVISSRCIDAWWQGGGIQEQIEYRMHDLSDGFAIAGVRSQPRKLANVSTVSAQLRSDDGSTYIDLNPTTKQITIVAPGGLIQTAPTIVQNAATSLTVNSPQSRFSGTVIVQGLLSWLAGMTGSIASGVASVITGATQFLGTVSANGKRIDDTHTHSGVEKGNDNSGSVN